MRKLIKTFRTSESGNIAILFGLAAIPLLIAVGIAIDYGRGVVAKHRLQWATDAAVLAAGSLKNASDEERKALGKAVFEANYPPSDYGLSVGQDFIKIDQNEVSAVAQHNVQTTLTRLTSRTSSKKLDYKASSSALVPQTAGAEIALVLDYSGSMNWRLSGQRKFEIMRDAAKELIDSVLDPSGENKVKFSLVPFSYGVKARLMRNHLLNRRNRKMRGTRRALTCVGGRKLDNNTDNDPQVTGDTRYRWKQNDLWTESRGRLGDASRTCGGIPEMRLLTANGAELKRDLDRWRPSGATHISSGFQFGWHSISPNTVFVDGAGYDKIAHQNPAKRIMKAIVLLTDGAQTSADYRRGSGTRNPRWRDNTYRLSVNNGEANLEAQCTNAKALGIVVVTVAFDLNDQSTIGRLDRCASPKSDGTGQFAFEATSASELKTAFEEIGNSLSQMVYLSD